MKRKKEQKKSLQNLLRETRALEERVERWRKRRFLEPGNGEFGGENGMGGGSGDVWRRRLRPRDGKRKEEGGEAKIFFFTNIA